MADTHSRNADGAALKFTLRFFDSMGEVTAMSLRLHRLERWKKRLEICVAAKTGWRQGVADSLHQTVSRWIEQVKESCVTCAIDQLHLAIDRHDEIAVEQPDRSFRPLRGDETYETLTSVEKSKGAWIFIFSPNNLTGNLNESVSYVM
ncbi:hypothetical protein K2Q00_01185 [Patescibacteria group bacterium]|nr:hypothetical protein [Patescibacteria group bacterium]